ncbi:MAG: hypothetical protein ABIY50_03335, partial [Ignavibacteria bacterium]
VINKSEGHFGNIDMEKIDQLLPGKDLIMDLICESIIEGKDVVLSDEMIKQVEYDLGDRDIPV